MSISRLVDGDVIVRNASDLEVVEQECTAFAARTGTAQKHRFLSIFIDRTNTSTIQNRSRSPYRIIVWRLSNTFVVHKYWKL
jgi:hypothetical protein